MRRKWVPWPNLRRCDRMGWDSPLLDGEDGRRGHGSAVYVSGMSVPEDRKTAGFRELTDDRNAIIAIPGVGKETQGNRLFSILVHSLLGCPEAAANRSA